MNTNTCFVESVSRREARLTFGVGLAALLIALPSACAERGGAARGGGARSVNVDRSSHGSIRHVETHVVQRPAEVRREPAPARGVEAARGAAPRGGAVPRGGEVRYGGGGRGDFQVHHDVEADFHRRHFWNDFAFGRRCGVLPLGFMTLQIGGVPFYYSDGVYYQPADDGGYQEVYPPLGADIPQPPDGAIAIDAGGQTYYYAGGAFYVQQPDGTYVIAPTPIGVVVPELPPGAIQVSVRGAIAYQFNGIYYEPVFVNGVTQYETFVP